MVAVCLAGAGVLVCACIWALTWDAVKEAREIKRLGRVEALRRLLEMKP